MRLCASVHVVELASPRDSIATARQRSMGWTPARRMRALPSLVGGRIQPGGKRCAISCVLHADICPVTCVQTPSRAAPRRAEYVQPQCAAENGVGSWTSEFQGSTSNVYSASCFTVRFVIFLGGAVLHVFDNARAYKRIGRGRLRTSITTVRGGPKGQPG